MKNWLLATIAGIAALLMVAAPIFGHHGTAAYDTTKLTTVKGTVTDFQFNNPHVMISVEAKDEKGGATFVATIPPASVDFGYRAWLRDGRTRRTAEVKYVPRPVVQKIDAWVLLPKYVGSRPDGSPYEQYRMRGEIAGPLGSSARVIVCR